MYVWLEKSTRWDLGLKLFTNNLENANQTLLQICPPEQITYPLINRGVLLGKVCKVCKELFCFLWDTVLAINTAITLKYPNGFLLWWTKLAMKALQQQFCFPFNLCLSLGKPSDPLLWFRTFTWPIILAPWRHLYLDFFGYAVPMKKSFRNQNH